ncbi:MAG: hypothetical protein N2C14_15910, partial [Planctomycetales bacterium]
AMRSPLGIYECAETPPVAAAFQSRPPSSAKIEKPHDCGKIIYHQPPPRSVDSPRRATRARVLGEPGGLGSTSAAESSPSS